jgi:hypothetical protein
VGPRAANKRHELGIELTSDRLMLDLEAGLAPAVTGEETAAARPPQLQFQCARRMVSREDVLACGGELRVVGRRWTRVDGEARLGGGNGGAAELREERGAQYA